MEDSDTKCTSTKRKYSNLYAQEHTHTFRIVVKEQTALVYGHRKKVGLTHRSCKQSIAF